MFLFGKDTLSFHHIQWVYPFINFFNLYLFFQFFLLLFLFSIFFFKCIITFLLLSGLLILFCSYLYYLHFFIFSPHLLCYVPSIIFHVNNITQYFRTLQFNLPYRFKYHLFFPNIFSSFPFVFVFFSPSNIITSYPSADNNYLIFLDIIETHHLPFSTFSFIIQVCLYFSPSFLLGGFIFISSSITKCSSIP